MSRIGGIVSRAWGVEQSAIDDTPKITYVRGGELMVENHGGIDMITENELKFTSGITVSGRKLSVEQIDKDFAVVIGKVEELSFADP